MISWMQKHKKWLVITIWISTIAFVGAGFVGWGSYNYGKSGGTIATVGELEIDMKELQKEYSGLYAQYEQMFGGSFNQETAEKLNLQEQAYNNLVQKYLILNLAKKYGITATDSEVAKELVKYEAFLKNGKFDKETYIKTLQLNQTNPTDFESSLKNDIIFYKTIAIFGQKVDDKETNILNKIFFSEDKVAIKVISSNDVDTTFSQDALLKYYETNKNNYKTTTQYKINVEKVLIGEDEKASKNEALKKYLNLKNGKEKFITEELISENETKFGGEIGNILKLKTGELLKPIKIENEYFIIKMAEKIAPKILTFEEAKEKVTIDYKKNLIKSKLEEKKVALLKNFTGESLGYINRQNPPAIPSLNESERDKLIEDIYSSKTVLNATSFEDKIVVFKIEDTKIGNFDSEKNQILRQNIEKIKNDGVIMSLLTKLQKEYETKSNMKVE